MTLQRILTGITTSGTPHLGNYVGAVRPSIRASLREQTQSFYFLADYHALIKTGDPARVQRSTLEIAASWLAAGLNPKHVVFYRQSDVPEIPELCWLLTCVGGKGLLNRAHAYKAAVDKNTAAGAEPDDGVTAGLFMYPVLMAADIVLFNAHQVPVGRDQVQHIEMARDLASSFNHLYGTHFTLPEAIIDDHVATLPGLDGRKMSKSYDNTIPLFTPRDQLRKAIMGIVTDSRAPGELKDTEGSALFQIYQAFATPAETDAMRKAFANGIAWGDAKQQVFERLDAEIAPMREVYEHYMNTPAEVEAILKAGATKARAIATPFMQQLRQAVGLRSLVSMTTTDTKATEKTALPSLKQYRESDGLFYFKLTTAQGDTLIQGQGRPDGRATAAAIALLQAQGCAALAQAQAELAPGISPEVADQALTALREAAEAKAAAKQAKANPATTA